MDPTRIKRILDTIPDDWADSIDPIELNARAEQAYRIALRGLRGGASASQPPEKAIERVLAGTGVNADEGLTRLRESCIQFAKMMIFRERYGKLFPDGLDDSTLFSPEIQAKGIGPVGQEDSGPAERATARADFKGEFGRSNSPLQIAYYRLAQAPIPWFPWQHKRRRARARAEGEFAAVLVRLLRRTWSDDPSPGQRLANLSAFSYFIAGLQAIPTFVMARSLVGTSGTSTVADPFFAPRVLLLPEFAGAFVNLVDMLEETCAYRLEDNVRSARDAIRGNRHYR